MVDNNSKNVERVIIDIDLKDLIPVFMENRKTDIKLLYENLSQGNYDKIIEIGHILKGLGSAYGFDEITRIGADIEKKAAKSDENQLKALIRDLEEYLDRVVVVFE